ncbi:DUF1702 family protein [Haloechinothrix sp. YIM 98757]|uniref:DUF1702 family protein n=1 Tax=Haloechinothrix aidingensis TaxID=2752311 RepID=A0A838A2B4_9PSEU|nr:DUF1702 family protein [Haloechinothrix aidingensis]MBA0125333.1 DUF1702 family protein [Haloechinothrix aidingensis]
MPTALGFLRNRLLAPSLSEVTFEERGFPAANGAEVSRLESIAQSVVCGFEWGMGGDDPAEIEYRLNVIDAEFRGFAYEGVTMAFTILDALRGGRGTRTRDLLRGPAHPHIFLTYIGIGFAMARLPRVLWKNVLPDLTGSPYYPTMSWLAVDGYGFDRAFFDTRRWVDEQYVPTPYSWDGAPGYFLRAVDQGIGRALWFVHGANVEESAAAVERFAAHRHADLFSGIGLAATFAGGASPDDLAKLRVLSGEHIAEVALGAVFAAKARSYAGFVPSHTELATTALAELSVTDAAAIADRAGVAEGDTAAGGEVPAYELWRGRIRARLD